MNYPTRLLFATCALVFSTLVRADVVEYIHTDLQGTVVAVTDENGTIIERRTYEPYGLPTTAIADGPGFTGHDMDGDTGLVYMQQRYYDPEIGRFLSVDPAGVNATSGENFNRYWYANGNPYRYVDSDGRWPTSIHNEIIDTAFPGLTDAQRQTLKKASSRMDSVIRGGQRISNSYQHAMRAPSQSPGDAATATNTFVADQVAAARNAQGQLPASVDGLSTESLSIVGNAIHTVTDRSSPAHTGTSGDPMIWSGLGGKDELIMAGAHAASESSISTTQMNAAVSEAQKVFSEAYGSRLRDLAIKDQLP